MDIFWAWPTPPRLIEGCRSQIPKDLSLFLIIFDSHTAGISHVEQNWKWQVLKKASLRRAAGKLGDHWPRLLHPVFRWWTPATAAPSNVTAVVWLMDLAWSLSWQHHYGCSIIHENKVSTILCKRHQETVPRKCSDDVVGHSGGFRLGRCWHFSPLLRTFQNFTESRQQSAEQQSL